MPAKTRGRNRGQLLAFVPLALLVPACAGGGAASPTSRPAGPASPAQAGTGRGADVFAAKGCGGCHTLASVPGARGTVGPPLDGIATRAATRKPGTSAEAYLRESIQAPNAFVVPGFPPSMPQIPVTDDELATLVQLLLGQQ